MSENVPTGEGPQQPPQQPPTPQYAPPPQYGQPQQPAAPQYVPPQQPATPQYAPPPQYGQPQQPAAPQYGQPQQPAPPQYTPPFVPPSQYQSGPHAPAQRSNGLAVAAMITGGVALLFMFLGLFFIPGLALGVLLSIAAITLGIIALVKKQQLGLALGGLITGAVGVIASIPIALFLALTPFFWGFTPMGSPAPYDSSPYDSAPWSEDGEYFDDWYPQEFCDELYALDATVSAAPDSDEMHGLTTPEARASLEELSGYLTYNDWVYAGFLELTAPGADQTFVDMEYEREYVLDAIQEDISGCQTNGFY